jgi:tetratricopeptide (TPR) repeat protein
MFRIGPTVLLAAGLASPAAGQSVYELLSPGRALARAADTDASGDVTAAERDALLASFESPTGTLERTDVIVRLLPIYFDADRDGVFTGADAAAHLAVLDTDGSGMLEETEVKASVGGSNGRGGKLLEGMVAFGADEDGNGSIDLLEWSVASEPLDAPVSAERLATWVQRAEQRGDGDGNAFGPATLLLSLRSGLDGTQDGLFHAGDLRVLLENMDTNGDGFIAADEMSARRGGGRWTGTGGSSGRSVSPTPLMPWQRTLEDALALQRETGKPLLICVNMDGEAASDSIARYRYHDPEFVKLAEGFIPLLASPNRHNTREFDDRGQRIPDDRFGRLIDAEHIDLEPIVYERYFGGQRVAPRHVGVAPDGTILFDLFLLQDLSAINRALEKHGNQDTALADVQALDLMGLLASSDAAARDRLEARFLESDEATRVQLAQLALDSGRSTQHPALVRLALRDPAAKVRATAVGTLTRHTVLEDVELFAEALRVASAESLRALSERLAAQASVATDNDKVRARRLSRMASAFALPSTVIDVELWRIAAAGVASPGDGPRDIEAIYAAIDGVGQRIREAPDDAWLRALAAELGLRGSEVLIASGAGNPGFVLMDARASAEKAVELDPHSTLGWACLASVAYQLGDYEIAGDAAARALPGLVDQASSKLAADVLYAFADSRVRTLYPLLGSEEGWPLEWVPDLLAAYDVLLVHPHGKESQALAAIGVQWNLEAFRVQDRFVREALERWPASAQLHDRHRARILRDEGAAGLAHAYEGIEGGSEDAATLKWYAGLAGFVAAERDVQDGRAADALATYRHSIVTFQEAMSLEPTFGVSSLHYVSLAYSGTARLLLDGGNLDEALAALRAGAQAYVGAFEAEDGLGNSPMETARDIRRALRRAQRDDAAEELSSYLSQRGVEL